MYKISKQNKEAIEQFLRGLVVPAQIGANCIAIADLLKELEEIKEEEDKKSPK